MLNVWKPKTTPSSGHFAAAATAPPKPKTFEERQALRRRKKYRTMEEMYGPDFLRTRNHA